MSYILDALKKAEQKKQLEEPFKTSVLFGNPQPVRKKMPFFLYLFSAVLLINGIVLILLFANPWSGKDSDKTIMIKQNNIYFKSVAKIQSSDSSSQQTQTVLNEPSKKPDEFLHTNNVGEISLSPTPKTKGIEVVPKEQIQTEKSRTKKNKGMGKSDQENGVIPFKNRLFNLNELPANIKDSLPTFRVSGHAYSPNRLNRVARVNEKILQEGDELSAGLKVEEITQDGIIFNNQGYRFLISINVNR